MTTPITNTPPVKISYLDPSLFIAFLQRESIPVPGGATRYQVARRVLNDASAGRIAAVTSVLTFAEVRHINDASVVSVDAELGRINGLLQHPSITLADLDSEIAQQAQRLGREYSLSPADAIHLATAVHWGCDELLVWDDRFIRRVNRHPIPGLWVGEPY